MFKNSLSVIFILGLILISSFGCSSKTTPVSGITVENEKQILEQIIKEINTENTDVVPNYDQDPEKYGVDSAKTIMMYSLYIEYFKQGNYQDARKYWNYLFVNAPKFNKGVYVNGAKMYNKFAKDEKDETAKKALTDTLMIILDQRIVYFNQEGYVMGEKGKNLFILSPGNYIEAYSYLKKSIELDSNKVMTNTPYYFMYTSSLMYKSKKSEVEQLLEDFQSSMSICEYNIAQGNKVEKWKKIIDNILQIIGPVLPPETLLPFLDEKFEKVKDDVDQLQLYLKIMDMKRLTTEDVYLKYSEEYLKHDPSAIGYWQNGNALFGKERYSEAVKSYSKSVELLNEEDDVTKAKYYMSLAETHRKLNNFPSARTYAQKAAAANPTDGTPYMFIGGLYAKSAKNCGSDGFKQSAVYWIAVDMYKIAASKGCDNANSAISNLRKAFPTKEKAFYQEPPVIEGKDYKIGCWINGTTKVRFIE